MASELGPGSRFRAQLKSTGQDQKDPKVLECEGIDLQRDGAPAIGHNGSFTQHWFKKEMHRLFLTRPALPAGNMTELRKATDPFRPFFLYIALQAMHVPSPGPVALEHFIRKYTSNGVTDQFFVESNALITVADTQLGDMRTVLEHAGRWDKTLLIHLSDNGGAVVYQDMGHAQGTNWPLRGMKRTYFEGGVRVPAFVTGGAVPPAMRGKQLDGNVHIADWFATIAHLAGARLTSSAGTVTSASIGDQAFNAPPKSVSMLSYLSGDWPESPRKEIILGAGDTGETVHGVEAIIDGEFKLINGTIPCSWDTWQGPVYPNASSPNPFPDLPRDYRDCVLKTTTYLFNIRTDAQERVNMASWENMSTTLSTMFSKLGAARAQAATESTVESEHDRALDNAMRTETCQAYVDANRGFLGPYMKGIQEDE